jgi:hypothetical protein
VLELDIEVLDLDRAYARRSQIDGRLAGLTNEILSTTMPPAGATPLP